MKIKSIYHIGEQNTEAWRRRRLGVFTSSEIYKLFSKPSKEIRAKKATEEVSSGLWGFCDEMTKEIPRDYDLTYAAGYTVKGGLLTKSDSLEAKKEVKSGKLTERACLLLRLCFAISNVQAVSGTFYQYCEDKALELAYGEPEDPVNSRALDWGNENEPIAIKSYQSETFNFGIKSNVSFVELPELQTGSSPDFLYQPFGELGVVPVEFKCPKNRKIHLSKHCKISNASELMEFSEQKAYQVQHQIFCLQADFAEWVSFDPRLIGKPKEDKYIHIVKIEKDKKIQQQFPEILKKAIEVRDEIYKSY